MKTNTNDQKKMTTEGKAKFALEITQKIQKIDRCNWFPILTIALTLQAGETYLLTYRNEVLR
jgi:hypothetical protein